MMRIKRLCQLSCYSSRICCFYRLENKPRQFFGVISEKYTSTFRLRADIPATFIFATRPGNCPLSLKPAQALTRVYVVSHVQCLPTCGVQGKYWFRRAILYFRKIFWQRRLTAHTRPILGKDFNFEEKERECALYKRLSKCSNHSLDTVNAMRHLEKNSERKTTWRR